MINVSTYKFVPIDETKLAGLRDELRDYTRHLGLKGSIILAKEGINCFVSGTPEQIQTFHDKLETIPELQGLVFKESPSMTSPFKRMLVKIKAEIIKMGVDDINPVEFTAPYLKAETFKQWYEQGQKMVVLDTRNDYEIQAGGFQNSIDLKIRNFSEFPDALQQLESLKSQDTPIVTLCTGGIRCEKAAALMLKKGFKNVYQLDGGILRYFEECGGDFYNGECFVFDKRITVNSNLDETKTIQCNHCRSPILEEQQKNCGGLCPFCQDDDIKDRLAA